MEVLQVRLSGAGCWDIRHARQAGLQYSTVAGGCAGAASTHTAFIALPCLSTHTLRALAGASVGWWDWRPGCVEAPDTSAALSVVCCVCAGVRYFDPDTVGLDFKGMMEDITAAPDGSIILLHGERLTDQLLPHCFQIKHMPRPARTTRYSFQQPAQKNARQICLGLLLV